MIKKSERDIEKVYSIKQFAVKLRRLADALEQGERFSIQVAGKRIYIPDKTTLLLALILWVYYSCIVFILGAEMGWAWSQKK